MDLGPGFLYTVPAGTSPDGPGQWVPIGVTEQGYSLTGEQHPDGSLTETQTYYTGGREVTVEITDPEAISRLAQALYPDWTIGDALTFLHPPPPRRTLARWLTRLDPVGTRKLPQGGPPAATYRIAQIMERHARWATRRAGP